MRGVRTEVTWATAVRTLDDQHRTTTWLRLSCVAVLWATVPWVDRDQHWRGALVLVGVTAGALLSYVHARRRLIEALDRVPGLQRLVTHLSGTRGLAKVDLPGLLEASGVLLAAAAYAAGPWGVRGMPEDVQTVALLAVAGFGWSVALNVMLDAGWYAPDGTAVVGEDRSSGPAPRVLTWLRAVMPGVLAVGAAALFVPDWTPELDALPVAFRAALAGGFLLLWLARELFEQTLAAADATAADRELAVRHGAAQDLHSLAKNSVVSVLTALDSAQSPPAEARGLTRNALVQLEEVRRSWLDPQASAGGGSLRTLWDAVLAVLPRQWRERCRLDGAAGGIGLASTDYQLARRLLSDLVTNALRAQSHGQVRVGAVLGTEDRPRITLTVRDDGPGMPDDALADPLTSLAVLDRELRRYDGALGFRPNTGEPGTTVSAHWRSPLPKGRDARAAPGPV